MCALQFTWSGCFVSSAVGGVIRTRLPQGKLELSVHLPLDYPNVEPELFVRSEGLNRTQSHNINQHLATHVQVGPRHSANRRYTVARPYDGFWGRRRPAGYF